MLLLSHCLTCKGEIASGSIIIITEEFLVTIYEFSTEKAICVSLPTREVREMVRRDKSRAMKTTKHQQYYVNNNETAFNSLPLASVHRVAAINLHRLIAQFSSQLHLMDVFKWQGKLSIRRLRCATFAFVIITACALTLLIRSRPSRLEAGAEIH